MSEYVTLHTDELAFYGCNMNRVTEPGVFYAWIGGSSDAGLQCEFELVESPRNLLAESGR